jgi:hypothetical protein
MTAYRWAAVALSLLGPGSASAQTDTLQRTLSTKETGCVPPAVAPAEETVPAWTAAVVKQLRFARYQPARRQGQAVRQWVHQLFTYHSDGRIQERR